jgi:dTDP-4-dehydrorhamnose reductase
MKPKIAILGKNGRLGAALCRDLSDQYNILAFGRAELDLTRPVREVLGAVEFDLLINAAAATNVDWCEQHPSEAIQINGRSVFELGTLCLERGVRCLHISTDYVFDGLACRPYREEDAAEPISVYGKAKRLGEELLLRSSGDHLAIRVSWVFGPDKPSFIDSLLEQAISQESIAAIDDKFSVPTYTLDFTQWIRPLLFDLPVGGILHLCNSGGCSWREYGQCAVDAARQEKILLKASEVRPIALDSMATFVARRPAYTVMDTEKFSKTTGLSPRPWQEAVREFVKQKFSKGR